MTLLSFWSLLMLLFLSAKITTSSAKIHEEKGGNSTDYYSLWNTVYCDSHKICIDNTVHESLVDHLLNVTWNHTINNEVSKSDLEANANVSSIEITFTDVHGTVLYYLKFHKMNKHLSRNGTSLGEEVTTSGYHKVNKPESVSGISGSVVVAVLLTFLLVFCFALLLDFHTPPPLDAIELVDVLVEPNAVGGEEEVEVNEPELTSQQHQQQEEEDYENEDPVHEDEEDQLPVREDEEDQLEEEMVMMFPHYEDSWGEILHKGDDRAKTRMQKELEKERVQNRRG